MKQEVYNLFAAISLGLTFLTAVAGLIVSIVANKRAAKNAKDTNSIAKESNSIARDSNTIAEKSNSVAEYSNFIADKANVVAERSNDIAQRSVYLNTVGPNREKWQRDLREATALYFTALTRICNKSDKDIKQAFVDFWHYHYLVSVYLSMEKNKDIFDAMEIVRQNAEIILRSVTSDQSEDNGRYEEADKAREIILYTLQKDLSPDLNSLILSAWEITKDQASKV